MADCLPVTRFIWLVKTLRGILAEGGSKGAFASFGVGAPWRASHDRIGLPFIRLLDTRLRRTAIRFAALIARLQNGILPARRRPQIRKPRPHQTNPVQAQSAPVLPRKRGWLVHAVSKASCCGGMMYDLLELPELQALIASDPRVGRILRPLCHNLGIRLPPSLQLPRRSRAPRAPKPKAPEPEVADPLAATRPSRPTNGDFGWPDPSRFIPPARLRVPPPPPAAPPAPAPPAIPPLPDHQEQRAPPPFRWSIAR